MYECDLLFGPKQEKLTFELFKYIFILNQLVNETIILTNGIYLIMIS